MQHHAGAARSEIVPSLWLPFSTELVHRCALPLLVSSSHHSLKFIHNLTSLTILSLETRHTTPTRTGRVDSVSAPLNLPCEATRGKGMHLGAQQKILRLPKNVKRDFVKFVPEIPDGVKFLRPGVGSGVF